jgi:hypothetical protein
VPMVALIRRIGPAGVLALAALVFAMPSGAHAAGCPEQPSAQTFLPWLDVAWYVPAPDGGLEGGGEGWTLSGGAAVVDGNQPYLAGERSLALPGGASATTAPMCIGIEHPTIRLFARNTGSPLSALAVSVVFRDTLGTWQALRVGVVAAGSRWAPTTVMPVVANLVSDRAAFRFTPLDDRGEWTVDDVYVDPYNRR